MSLVSQVASRPFHVGAKLYDELLNTFPELFVAEIQRKEKWSKIPQEVHDAYFKELTEREEPLMKTVRDLNVGIWQMMHDNDAAARYHTAWEKIRPELDQIKDEVYNKHYAPYGV